MTWRRQIFSTQCRLAAFVCRIDARCGWPGYVQIRTFPQARHDAKPCFVFCVRSWKIQQNQCESRMASTRGFEPPTPGFIPLRLSPPPAGVRGLDCPSAMDPKVDRRCPSSLYTFLRRGLARDRHAASAAKRSPTLSRSVMVFPAITPNFRNPVLYPAELRGHGEQCSLPDPFNQK